MKKKTSTDKSKVAPFKSMRCMYSRLSYYGTNEAKKKSYVALYGIFRISSIGVVQGLTECSFSMEWSSTEVAIVPLDSAQYYFDKYKESGYQYFIYRLTRKSKNRMIIADFKSRKEELTELYDKYRHRNIEFYVNPDFGKS